MSSTIKLTKILKLQYEYLYFVSLNIVIHRFIPTTSKIVRQDIIGSTNFICLYKFENYKLFIVDMLRNILYLRAQCSKIKSRPF